jgi:hypothetical protein
MRARRLLALGRLLESAQPADAPITEKEPGESAGVALHALPEVWILDLTGADQTSGLVFRETPSTIRQK